MRKKKKKLVSNILKEINGNDPVRKKDIEKLNERIEKLHVYSENKDKNIFSFNFGHLPEFFIKREEVLNELEKKLSSKNQEVEMSRMILIHGNMEQEKVNWLEVMRIVKRVMVVIFGQKLYG